MAGALCKSLQSWTGEMTQPHNLFLAVGDKNETHSPITHCNPCHDLPFPWGAVTKGGEDKYQVRQATGSREVDKIVGRYISFLLSHKKLPQIQQLKTIPIYDLTIAVGRDSGQRLTGSYSAPGPTRLQSSFWLRLSSHLRPGNLFKFIGCCQNSVP